MKALLYKDFLVLRKSLLILLVALAFMAYIDVHQAGPTLFPLVFVLIPMILLGILFASDAQAKVDLYIIPGPISRRAIVRSRYFLVWLVALIGTLVALGLKTFIYDGFLAQMPWYFLATTMPLLITLISAIQLPLMYKFGAEKGRVVFVVLYLLVFAFFTSIGNNTIGFVSWIEQLLAKHVALLSLVMAGFTLLINAISLALSTRIYEREEF